MENKSNENMNISNMDAENEGTDKNSSGSSLSPIPTNALNPIPPPAAVLPRISEKESQLANEVGRLVGEGHYLVALDKVDKSGQSSSGPMTSLMELRPDDPIVAANACYVAYMAGEYTLDVFQSKLQTLFNSLISNGAGELDDGEQCSLLYNLALSYFRKRDFKIAEKILKRLYNNLTSCSSVTPTTGTINSSPSDSPQGATGSNLSVPTIDLIFCHSRVLPLLISVCLSMNNPVEAIFYINELTSSNSDDHESGSMHPIIARARALVQMRQHKLFKKDLKSAQLQGDLLTAYEFLRSNLEYFKGNHRKALKLLGLAMQQHQTTINSSESQSEEAKLKVEDMKLYISSLYTNNMGCINLMLGKPNHGVLYFERALTQHTQCITSNIMQEEICSNAVKMLHQTKRSEEANFLRSQKRKDIFLRIKQNEISYNLGVALLHAGNFQKAFETFLPTVKVFGNVSASLWLHLAECCIMAYNADLALRKGETGECNDMKQLHKNLYDPNASSNVLENEKVVPMVKLNVVGYGDHRKIILSNNNVRYKQESKPVNKTGSIKPTISMEFAYYCLKNALVIANHNLSIHEPQTNISSTSTSTSSSLSKPNSAPGSTQASPSKSLPATCYNSSNKWQMLRITILLNLSYVGLCLTDPVIALENAETILAYENENSSGSNISMPGGYKILAHIYAADALIQLDRLSEAIAHVDPTSKSLSTVDFTFSLDSISSNPNSAEENNDISSTYQKNGKKTPGMKTNQNDNDTSTSGNSSNSSPRRNSQSSAVAAVLQYNLIVALSVRGELDKADEMAESLWKKNGKQSISLMFYLRISILTKISQTQMNG